MNRKFDIAKTGEGWDAFDLLMRERRHESWYKYATGWPSLQFARMAWNEVLRYQPEIVLKKVDCPVLAMLGDRDVIAPMEETTAALRAAFDGDREGLLDVSVVHHANHLLLEADNGSIRFSDELESASRYAEGYFDTLASWLDRRPKGVVIAATSAR